MTRCPEFYEKFEKDGNFCGLSTSAISQIKAYRELIDKIVKTGIDKTVAYNNFPEATSRTITSIKDDGTRTKALNYVVASLKAGKSVTGPELKNQIKEWLGAGSCTVEKHDGNPGHVSKKFTKVNSPTEQKPDSAPIQETPAQPSLSAQLAGTTPPEQPPVHRPPPCLGGSGCTHGKFRPRVSKDAIKGDLCDAAGVEIAQLPGNVCPLDAKLSKNANTGFERASGDLSVLAAKPAETPRPAYKIVRPMSSVEEISDHTQQFVDDLPEAARDNIHRLLKADKGVMFDGDPRELIIVLLQEKAETLGGA